MAAELEAASTTAAVEAVRVAWLGRRGRITEALRGLGALPVEARREAGQRLNRLREAAEAQIKARLQVLKAQEEAETLAAERLDMSWPGRRPPVGRLHPVTRVRRLVEDIFLRMGFAMVDGPEVESLWYNFEALNMPEHHPARDMQDSFFVNLPGMVLRTQTSPMQIRAMEAAGGRLPVRIIATGRVYRRDDDATHVPMFTQMEALVIDRGIGMADLKGTLLAMSRALFGPETAIRLRPSYFPFTEPSAEVDVTCAVCGGRGCRTCKDTGWLEILGAGMVHPVVLQNGGYDPEAVSGFAFGLGLERVAMIRYGFDDLRLLYQNDWRFLAQFGRGEDGM
ncbi:MAG: phenylalanine--tRNA ligase subunit alpha [Firmicutes bacterium]|nr:phenylalanine--tRNA ligase subunit alpha [Alicyclobacillaceae bacterium]MCL6498307.1 phenylalanine--tRNA ligase subunit alpha [Bacillota bacterium]